MANELDRLTKLAQIGDAVLRVVSESRLLRRARKAAKRRKSKPRAPRKPAAGTETQRPKKRNPLAGLDE